MSLLGLRAGGGRRKTWTLDEIQVVDKRSAHRSIAGAVTLLFTPEVAGRPLPGSTPAVESPQEASQLVGTHRPESRAWFSAARSGRAASE